jgi:hypothetical protein
MKQPDSSPADSPLPASTGETSGDLHERTARLRQKVGDLAKTFERIEQNLAEATRDPKDSAG